MASKHQIGPRLGSADNQYEIADNVRRGYALCEQIEGHIRDAHILLARLKRLAQPASGLSRTSPSPEDRRIRPWLRRLSARPRPDLRQRRRAFTHAHAAVITDRYPLKA